LVFVLYELEGLSGKETAEIAGIPEATVYTRLHYARRTFRAALGEGEAA
jgi:DNA-directed RNA polymerase specialized sigma24 family protein